LVSTISRRGILVSLTAGAAVAGLAACSSGSKSAGTKAATTAAGTAASLAGKTIRVGTFKNNHVASALFWPKFAPKGLTVQVTTLGSGSDMNRALEADRLDFATFGVVNGFVEAEQGVGSRIIGTAARQGAALIVRRESTLVQMRDLAGKRIGVKAPSFQSLVLLSLLNEAGLSADTDVKLVPLEWNDMPTALEKGDVDGYMGTEPNPSRSVAGGAGRRLINPYTTPVGQLNSCLWASGAIFKSDPALAALRSICSARPRSIFRPAATTTLPCGRSSSSVSSGSTSPFSAN